MLLHEASIIATKERAEMKMIEFFIARKIVVDGAGHFNHKAPCVVKRAGFVDGIMAGSSAIRQSKTILARAGFVDEMRGIRGHPAIRNASSAPILATFCGVKRSLIRYPYQVAEKGKNGRLGAFSIIRP
jgi:hypothetical protein